MPNKKGQLGPVTDFENLRTHFSSFENVLKPLFYSVFDKHCFEKNKLGPVIDFEKGQTWTNYWLHSKLKHKSRRFFRQLFATFFANVSDIIYRKNFARISLSALLCITTFSYNDAAETTSVFWAASRKTGEKAHTLQEQVSKGKSQQRFQFAMVSLHIWIATDPR